MVGTERHHGERFELSAIVAKPGTRFIQGMCPAGGMRESVRIHAQLFTGGAEFKQAIVRRRRVVVPHA